MPSTLFRFKTNSLRNLPLPKANEGLTIAHAAVKIKDIPEELLDWNSIRTSNADTGSELAKEIKKSIKERPDLFFFMTKGITITADRFNFDTRKQEIAIEMSDKDLHGILNGRLLFKVMREACLEGEDKNAMVNVEIICGMRNPDEVYEVAEARSYN